MDHTIKGLIGSRTRPAPEAAVWRASPASLAGAGARALSVSDVSDGLAARLAALCRDGSRGE